MSTGCTQRQNEHLHIAYMYISISPCLRSVKLSRSSATVVTTMMSAADLILAMH